MSEEDEKHLKLCRTMIERYIAQHGVDSGLKVLVYALDHKPELSEDLGQILLVSILSSSNASKNLQAFEDMGPGGE